MESISHFFNDGSGTLLNLGSISTLTTWSTCAPIQAGPASRGWPRYQRLKDDGFEGVQLTITILRQRARPIPHCGLDRINAPADAETIAARHADRGDRCITVHVGWGLEDDDECFGWSRPFWLLQTSTALPIFIETHRATITQDVWRTVQITKKFPEVRFNGDFSHYYCGLELVYGDWNEKLASWSLFSSESASCMAALRAQAVSRYAPVSSLRALAIPVIWITLKNSGPAPCLAFFATLSPGTC